MFLGDASIDETLDNSMSFNTDISSIDDSFLITDTEQDDGHTKDRITVSAGIQNHNCFVTSNGTETSAQWVTIRRYTGSCPYEYYCRTRQHLLYKCDGS